MPYVNIPYKSYAWSLGTTSFRTKNFNLTIERQLGLLSEFWDNSKFKNSVWCDAQADYYDFMLERNFVKELSLKGTKTVEQKEKDSRETTSGLVDIGLIYDDRRLSEAGKYLLEISQSGDFSSDNDLQIPKDSFVYLKQLLKTCNVFDSGAVRPFIILLFLLSKLDYLTMDEYTYLLPLCINKQITDTMPDKIQCLREGTISIDEVIIETFMGMENYQKALDLFIGNNIDEELICTVGFNRKSRNYDKPYYPLYKSLRELCINKNTDFIFDVYEKTKKIKVGKWWRSFLFDTSSARAISKSPEQHYKKTILSTVKDEKALKIEFFKLMHLFKIKANLTDYLDLNRRYINTSDTVLFEDDCVKLDIVPKQFFNSIIGELYIEAFSKTDLLFENCNISDISKCLVIDEKAIISGINEELSLNVSTMEEARNAVENERYRRFNQLVDSKFNDENLIALLGFFENREDSEIYSLVTDNADAPTIFEYILGVIWYKASERKGKILDFMKLSLEANLLPKTHAGGGEADIVYEYESTKEYPAHSLLLEATLAESTNQRRMEMEPVSRHLGNHLLRTGNLNSYCVFATNDLNINVISDFRSRKTTPFFDTQDDSRYVDGMKIIPMKISGLKAIIRNKIKYDMLYPIFETAYQATSPVPKWYAEYIAKSISE